MVARMPAAEGREAVDGGVSARAPPTVSGVGTEFGTELRAGCRLGRFTVDERHTWRRTPTSWAAISPADWKRWTGSAAVAFTMKW